MTTAYFLLADGSVLTLNSRSGVRSRTASWWSSRSPTKDWPRIHELMQQYLDLPLGMVDASVIAAAERRGIEIIATLDHRNFRVVRPRHVQAFTLVP